jgi:hypothetical protein
MNTATTTLPTLRKALVNIGAITAAEAADPATSDSTLRRIVASHSFASCHKATIAAACAADGTPLPPARKRMW